VNLESMPVKELARHLLPLIKRNLLEWRFLKKEFLLRNGAKDMCRDEDKIEKIILSEPVANFYAHWLKFPNSKENNQKLCEKITNYIKGLFFEELKDEKTVKMFLAKCALIANIHHRITPKMIESALALQDLMNPEKISSKEMFESEKAFKIITKSSMTITEWRLMIIRPIRWVIHFEMRWENLQKIKKIESIVLSKREKEIFS